MKKSTRIKRFVGIATLVLLVVLTGCFERKPLIPINVSLEQVLDNTSRYTNVHRDSILSISDATVLYQAQEGARNILILATNPLPWTGNNEEISEDQIFSAVVPIMDYRSVVPGNIVKLIGRLNKIESDSLIMYFLNTNDLEIVGNSDIPDSDFQRIVAMLEDKRSDDDDGFSIIDAYFNPFSAEYIARDLLFGDDDMDMDFGF